MALGFFWATCAPTQEKPYPDAQAWEIYGHGHGVQLGSCVPEGISGYGISSDVGFRL